jgi:hypothetical protein
LRVEHRVVLPARVGHTLRAQQVWAALAIRQRIEVLYDEIASAIGRHSIQQPCRSPCRGMNQFGHDPVHDWIFSTDGRKIAPGKFPQNASIGAIRRRPA